MIRFIVKTNGKFVTVDEETPKLAKLRHSSKSDFEVVGYELINESQSFKASKQARTYINHELPLVYDGTLSISLLGLMTRNINALRKAGYTTLQDIADSAEVDIIKVNGCGFQAYSRVVEALKQSGLDFNGGTVYGPTTLYEFDKIKIGLGLSAR